MFGEGIIGHVRAFHKQNRQNQHNYIYITWSCPTLSRLHRNHQNRSKIHNV